MILKFWLFLLSNFLFYAYRALGLELKCMKIFTDKFIHFKETPTSILSYSFSNRGILTVPFPLNITASACYPIVVFTYNLGCQQEDNISSSWEIAVESYKYG